MSSRQPEHDSFTVLCIEHEGLVDDIRELALEGSAGFGPSIAHITAASKKVLGLGVAASLGERNAVKGAVELAVAGATQSESLGV
jgi:alkylhydroperoxidase/carboxymuconolactone decarboxylase family protein YurZ